MNENSNGSEKFSIRSSSRRMVSPEIPAVGIYSGMPSGSPSPSSTERRKTTYSPRIEGKQIAINEQNPYFRKTKDENLDVFKYYANAAKQEKQDRQEKQGDTSQLAMILERMNERQEKNDEMMKIMIERMDRIERRETPRSERKSPSGNYRTLAYVSGNPAPQPQQEEEENEDIPDFDNMDESEIKYYKTKYENNFKLLKKSYPWYVLTTPDVNSDLSLISIHKIYCDMVSDINLYQLAMKLKVVLVLFFAGIEYLGHKYKIKALKGFLSVQVKRIEKYTPFLMEMAKMFSSKTIKKFPSWMVFIFNIASALCSFFAVRSFYDDDKGSILAEVDKFVTPVGGRVAYKDDKIPEVPKLPGEFQDPENITKWIPGAFSTIVGDNDDEESQVRQPVAAKPIDEKDTEYDIW